MKTLCRQACVSSVTGSGVSPPGGHHTGDTPGHAALSEVPIGNSAASGAQQPSVPVLGRAYTQPSVPPAPQQALLLVACPPSSAPLHAKNAHRHSLNCSQCCKSPMLMISNGKSTSEPYMCHFIHRKLILEKSGLRIFGTFRKYLNQHCVMFF